MKARLNIITLLLSFLGLTAHSLYILGLKTPPPQSITNLVATGIVALVGMFCLIRYNRQLQYARARIRSWRSFSRKTSRSAHKFIIDRIVDLRRPLQGLVGIHDLYTNANSKQEGLDFLDIADFCSRYLIRQLERIQFYSEIELDNIRFDKNIFSLHKCVQDSITLAAEQAKANHVTIVEDYSANTPEYVYGNEMSLRKILIELIDNSVRHAGNTKTTIRILPDPENNEKLLFVVSDTGAGISNDKVQEILAELPAGNKSVPWRDAREGMGLILVKKILQKLQGNLNATSQSGIGTTISFSLPAENLSASHKPENIINSASQAPKILVVDDEDVTRQILTALFRRLNLKVDQAVNGYDAIEKAKTTQYDLIIMDLSMPIIDGFVAARTIFNLTNYKVKPKIVIASSHCRQEDRDRCEAIGVSGFMAKPVRFEALRQRLMELGFIKDRVEVSPNNVIAVNFKNEKAKSKKARATSYYINFNSLFNSLEENMAMCQEILNRVSSDVTKAIEDLATALKKNDRKTISNILHRIHGELSMAHCIHGLEAIQAMQAALKSASEEELQVCFENISEFIDELCEEIDGLVSDSSKPMVA